MKRLLRHPLITFTLLCLGLITAMVLAPRTGQELKIAQGGEIVLLALGRFLLRRQLAAFMWSLLLVALCLPLIAGFSASLYYHGDAGFLSAPFCELAGIGLALALPLAGLAIWGIRRARPERPVAASDPRWLAWLGWVFEGAIWLIIFTLGEGEWSDPAVASVGLGALVFLTGMLVLIYYRLSLGLRGVGILMMILGAVTCIFCGILLATQDNRMSEAAIGFAPGGLLVIIGFILRTVAVTRQRMMHTPRA